MPLASAEVLVARAKVARTRAEAAALLEKSATPYPLDTRIPISRRRSIFSEFSPNHWRCSWIISE